jgi:hypothetical protein
VVLPRTLLDRRRKLRGTEIGVEGRRRRLREEREARVRVHRGLWHGEQASERAHSAVPGTSGSSHNSHSRAHQSALRAPLTLE